MFVFADIAGGADAQQAHVWLWRCRRLACLGALGFLMQAMLFHTDVGKKVGGAYTLVVHALFCC